MSKYEKTFFDVTFLLFSRKTIFPSPDGPDSEPEQINRKPNFPKSQRERRKKIRQIVVPMA